MAFGNSDDKILAQQFNQTSTTQNVPLGTIRRGVDPVLGEGEFIYLLGVANTIVGSAVVWDATTFQTALAPVGSNKPRPIAFAMSANVAAQYGWYQISGQAVAAKTSGLAIASNAAVGILTAGLVAASASGKEVQGALTMAKATVPKVITLNLDRPHMQGRVT